MYIWIYGILVNKSVLTYNPNKGPQVFLKFSETEVELSMVLNFDALQIDFESLDCPSSAHA